MLLFVVCCCCFVLLLLLFLGGEGADRRSTVRVIQTATHWTVQTPLSTPDHHKNVAQRCLGQAVCYTYGALPGLPWLLFGYCKLDWGTLSLHVTKRCKGF